MNKPARVCLSIIIALIYVAFVINAIIIVVGAVDNISMPKEKFIQRYGTNVYDSDYNMFYYDNVMVLIATFPMMLIPCMASSFFLYRGCHCFVNLLVGLLTIAFSIASCYFYIKILVDVDDLLSENLKTSIIVQTSVIITITLISVGLSYYFFQ